MLQMNEGSRSSITNALWSYVKIHKLQDKVDRRSIKCDAKLKTVTLLNKICSSLLLSQQLSGLDVLMFQQLSDVIERHVMAPDPFVLPYTIQYFRY
jgi:SWI/SNF-related matrix-associated actin-dependent regulator of chromatin subfamily D